MGLAVRAETSVRTASTISIGQNNCPMKMGLALRAETSARTSSPNLKSKIRVIVL
jgi:ribosomal protein L15E